MTPTLRRLAPPPLRRALKRGRSAAHVARSHVEMTGLRRHYAERYGPDFVFEVDERDEMLAFMRDHWSWEHHVVPMRAPSDALRTYFLSGEGMLRELESVLADHGRDLADTDSFLEFAAGYGRFTRFLVTQMPPSKVTISDIDRDAVDFSRETFGVSGLYSTTAADDLDHADQYDVIFVASLFSHLAIGHWRDWLRRLYELLAPHGLLLFSVHGPYARDVIFGEHWRDRLEPKDDGFSYLLTNETGGRLAADYYGSAFVTEDFVRREVSRLARARMTAVHPLRLWGSQDLYVVQKLAAG